MTRSDKTSKDWKKLIIFARGGGRLGNQLINYGHLIAFLLETNLRYDLVNLAFWEYSHLFENLYQNGLCTAPTVHKRIDTLKLFNFAIQIFPQKWVGFLKSKLIDATLEIISAFPQVQVISISQLERKDKNNYLYLTPSSFILGSQESLNLLEQTSFTILEGYEIRNWMMFQKHEDTIRNMLAIRNNYLTLSQEFVRKLRKKYNYLIGVFVRQGDFRYYAGGRYFFDSTQYREWIDQAKEIFSHRGTVGFIVSSDEIQEKQMFRDPDIHFATGTAGGNGHYIETMAELSQCDLILTPPSTFSVWSAFLGKVPLIPLYDRSQKINPQDILHNHIFDAIDRPHLSVAVK